MLFRPGNVPRLNLPPEHVIDTQKKLVIVRFGSRLTINDIGRYVTLLRANPSFHSDFAEIADLRKVEEINLQGDDFLKLADEIDPFSPQAKRAFVATSSVQTHAARMHKILLIQRNVEIFRSIEEAERWITT